MPFKMFVDKFNEYGLQKLIVYEKYEKFVFMLNPMIVVFLDPIKG